jgi:hypothetical protein
MTGDWICYGAMYLLLYNCTLSRVPELEFMSNAPRVCVCSKYRRMAEWRSGRAAERQSEYDASANLTVTHLLIDDHISLNMYHVFCAGAFCRCDRLCGLVATVPDYTSGGSGLGFR